MRVDFWKYQGTGNDFVMVDNRTGSFDTNREHIKWLCDRRFGIGADGLICLENTDEAQFRMVYFNSDGNESTFCGNGGRCIVAFAVQLGVAEVGTPIVFVAKDGIHYAHWHHDLISLQMKDVPEIKEIESNFELFTGSPHLVQWVTQLAAMDVKAAGAAIRFSPRNAKDGINVNFMERMGDGIFVRTYERGVEDETLSCGTGVTAAALVAANAGVPHPVSVKTPGGTLVVDFQKTAAGFSNIFLTGPASCVFAGSFDV